MHGDVYHFLSYGVSLLLEPEVRQRRARLLAGRQLRAALSS